MSGAMAYSHLKYHVDHHLAEITLSRPEKRNALNGALVDELIDAVVQSGKNGSVRAIVLSGEGESFCSGADLDYLQQLSAFSLAENHDDSKKLMRLFQLIYEIRKPVVAMVNGPAIAGGCGLATVCDFTFASKQHAKFGYSEVKIGFIPALVMVFLMRRVGEGRARELVLSGEIVDADEAYRMGLVTQVIDHERLEEETRKFARELVENNSGNSMALVKEMLATVGSMDFLQALDYAANMNAVARMTDDCKRGIAAFLKKEKIQW